MNEDVVNRSGLRLTGPEAIAAVLFTGPMVSLTERGLGDARSESESPGERPRSVADTACRASESRPDPSTVDDHGSASRPAGRHRPRDGPEWATAAAARLPMGGAPGLADGRRGLTANARRRRAFARRGGRTGGAGSGGGGSGCRARASVGLPPQALVLG
jgi:hypothetical protein